MKDTSALDALKAVVALVGAVSVPPVVGFVLWAVFVVIIGSMAAHAVLGVVERVRALEPPRQPSRRRLTR